MPAEIPEPVEEGRDTLVLGGVARDYNRDVMVEMSPQIGTLAFGDKVGLNPSGDEEPADHALRLRARMERYLSEQGWPEEAIQTLFDIPQSETVGGAGANNVRSATYMQRALGIEADAVLLAISDSTMAEQLFAVHGIDQRYIFPGQHTTSLIFNPEGVTEGDRAVYVMRGPQVTVEQFDQAVDGVKPRLLIVSSVAGDMELMAHAVDQADNSAVNPGGKEIRQRDELLDILKDAAVVSMNDLEAERLIYDDPERKETEEPNGEITASTLSKTLGRGSAETLVVVTQGKKGMALASSGGAVTTHVSAANIGSESRKLYTLGAGDAAFSTLAVAYIQAGMEPGKAARIASEASSQVVRSPETYVSPEHAVFATRALSRIIRQAD